jgi:hypothetical protein
MCRAADVEVGAFTTSRYKGMQSAKADCCALGCLAYENRRLVQNPGINHFSMLDAWPLKDDTGRLDRSKAFLYEPT